MERANVLMHQYDHLFKEFLENRETGWGLYQLIGINIFVLICRSFKLGTAQCDQIWKNHFG